MQPILSLTFSGAAHDEGGTWLITVGMRHHGDVTCVASKSFPLPIPAAPQVPWEWAQHVLQAAIAELDCLCDVTIEHGKGCPEAVTTREG